MSVDTMNSLRITRLIQANQQAVWDAWTQTDQMKQWSCPEPGGVQDIASDLRVGGSYTIAMRVDGNAHTAIGTYKEIDAPNRLVYTWDWKEEDNRMGETLVTVEFEARGDATEVVLLHTGFPAVEAKDGHEKGWGACMAHFEGLFLRGLLLELTLARVGTASKRRVAVLSSSEAAMSIYERAKRVIPVGIVLTLLVGCAGPAEDEVVVTSEMTAMASAGTMSSTTISSGMVLPPSGITGTPADNITDPALRMLPNPNPTVITHWGKLPDERVWGSTAGADIGPDGHVWAYDRCGGGLDGGCDRNLVDPIVKYDRNTGELLAAFGAGLFVTPHGIHVDDEGNVWVTDFAGNEAGTKGHQVIKFSPDGEILMRLGQAGVPGSGPGQLNQPNDVITSPNGDIFVADGHSGQGDDPAPGSTGRILKYTASGEFITEWGEIGIGPGEFRTPHALEMDSRGRLFVADRGNHRIQIFDQDGNYLDSYYQFSRISGLFITADDMLYAIDSETRDTNHPGWSTGIRIGRAHADVVTAFIPGHAYQDRPWNTAGEGVAVDADGNVYGAEGPGSRPAVDGGLTKYVIR